jgi:hypothetical protein
MDAPVFYYHHEENYVDTFRPNRTCFDAVSTVASCSGQKIETLKDAICCDGPVKIS